MVKKGKIRVCVTLDEEVYKKLCFEVGFLNNVYKPIAKFSKSDVVNSILKNHSSGCLVRK